MSGKISIKELDSDVAKNINILADSTEVETLSEYDKILTIDDNLQSKKIGLPWFNRSLTKATHYSGELIDIENTQPFDYLDCVYNGNSVITKATLAFTPTTITTTGVDFAGFSVGDVVTISGCAITANNKVATITAVASKILTFASGTFTAGTEVGDAKIASSTKTYSIAVSPDNPQTIANVGDSGSFKIRKSGKNLLPNTATSQTINGVTFAVNADKSITVNGTATANTVYDIFNSKLNIPTGTQIILSGSPKGGSYLTYGFMTVKTDWTGGKQDFGNGNTFNITSDYIKFYIFVQKGTIASNLVFKPQLEVGTTATPYEPYIGTEYTVPLKDTQGSYLDPMRKLPNGVADMAFKDSDGLWKRRGNTKEYTLLASDITSLVTSGTNIDYVKIALPKDVSIPMLPNESNKIITSFSSCSSELYSDNLTLIGKHGYGTNFQGASKIVLYFIAKGKYTLAQAQTALAGTKIIYQLATPVITTLHTDTQTVLNEAEKLLDGETNIYGSDAVSPSFDVEYYKGAKSAEFAKKAETSKIAETAVWADQIATANNLTETVAGKALDATQGKVLDGKITALNESLTQVSSIKTAVGTATDITLTTETLFNGYTTTFIASASNSGSATTINGISLYKPNTTTTPTLIAGKAYTVWYNSASNCFFIKASADGTAVAGDVLAGKTFSNDADTGITGTLVVPKYATGIQRQSGDHSYINITCGFRPSKAVIYNITDWGLESGHPRTDLATNFDSMCIINGAIASTATFTAYDTYFKFNSSEYFGYGDDYRWFAFA